MSADRHSDSILQLLCTNAQHGGVPGQQVWHAQGCADISPGGHGLWLISGLCRHGQTPPQGAYLPSLSACNISGRDAIKCEACSGYETLFNLCTATVRRTACQLDGSIALTAAQKQSLLAFISHQRFSLLVSCLVAIIAGHSTMCIGRIA